MKKRNILLYPVLFFILFSAVPQVRAQEGSETPARSVEDQRRAVLRFGTSTEIVGLIQTIRAENVSYLDDELIALINVTANRPIIIGIFGFFGETGKTGLEERAIRAIEYRDNEGNDVVLAAIDYLGRVNAREAVAALEEIVDSGEGRFLNNAIRALGRAGQHNDETALFLLDQYKTRNPSAENQRELIVAMGETGSALVVEFLAAIVSDSEERMVLHMAALEALAKIGDPGGLDAIIMAVSSADPNVRSTAVSALGPFSGPQVDQAILEGFRDDFYRTRIGAAQAAGRRQLEEAIEFLQYRAETDSVPQVRVESIRALGAINSRESIGIVETFFTNRRNSDQVRLVALEVLLQYHADQFAPAIVIEMDAARALSPSNPTALYNGFIRLLSTARSDSFEALARRLAGGSIIEKSLSLDLILNNSFRSLEDEMRALLDPRNGNPSLIRKAQSTLEQLGFTIEEE
ncbi:MAG: HEAT repeat domain-containing protein [Treponema sp.]|nr:HEAT repeat domain-containing protein [Treponema sp.]